MESKKYSLDSHWILVFGVGMLVHLTNICVAEFCGDEVLQPDLGSTLFTMSLLVILGRGKVYPESLRKPHRLVETVFEVVTHLVVANTAIFVVWIPILVILKTCFMKLSKITHVQEEGAGGGRLSRPVPFLRQRG